jgi:HlyD family secretion protein
MSGKKILVFFVILAVLGILGVTGYFVYKFISTPSLKSGEFETSRVDRGSVIDYVPATGVVQPGSEVLLLSPESSVIKEIVMEPGSHVEAGESIIILDPKPIQDRIESLKDQLEVKQNSLDKNMLNARSIKVDLEYNVEVKKLKITSLKSKLADQKQLLDVGGISPAKFEQTKQELVLAEKDLETIMEKNSIRLEQLKADLEGLKLQIGIQEKDLAAKEELLKRMVIRAPSAGIILQVYGKKGERVNNHKLLVKMSDLSAFKIEGSIEDKLAGKIETGKMVYALIDNEKLSGQIGNISPEVTNNRIEFDVFLKQNNHKKLLPNMSIDLLVVNAKKDSVLRIKSGPALEKDEAEFDVYLIKSGLAKRTRIMIGLRGSEYIEIVSGVEEGDKMIVSDISVFRNIEEIVIQ